MTRKQIYKIEYPTGKIYIGRDAYGNSRYFGSPDPAQINADFETLPVSVRIDDTVRKQILGRLIVVMLNYRKWKLNISLNTDLTIPRLATIAGRNSEKNSNDVNYTTTCTAMNIIR